MQKVKLKEIIGKAISGEWGTDDIDGTGVPVLRTANFTNNGVISYKNVILRNLGAKVCSEKFLHHGDIIIEKSGGSDKQPVGRVVYFDGENNKYLFNNFTALLRVKDQDKWSTKYVFYYLFNSYAKGNTLKFQNKTTGLHNLQLDNYINSLCVFEITYNEQIYIVNEIDKVVDLIEKRKKQIEKLDELVRSRFIEMFGAIGKKIKDWNYEPISCVCEINPKKSENKTLQNDTLISFVPMPAVTETGDIDVSETKLYKDVKNGFTYFCDNDVLFAKITPCMENGKGAIAKNLRNGIGFGSTEFHVLRPIKGVSNSEWIYFITVFVEFRLAAEKMMTGSAGQRRVPVVFFDKFKVAVPPIELQNKFAEFVEKVEKTKPVIKKSLSALETLKKSLMQKYFG